MCSIVYEDLPAEDLLLLDVPQAFPWHLLLAKDPFGSVDAPTAAWILEDQANLNSVPGQELLCGELLQHRARVVALQPEMAPRHARAPGVAWTRTGTAAEVRSGLRVLAPSWKTCELSSCAGGRQSAR